MFFLLTKFVVASMKNLGKFLDFFFSSLNLTNCAIFYGKNSPKFLYKKIEKKTRM
jgi:hypothetical protein